MGKRMKIEWADEVYDDGVMGNIMNLINHQSKGIIENQVHDKLLVNIPQGLGFMTRYEVAILVQVWR